MDISSMKVSDLKAELSKRSLPTTGLKQALADRLREALLGEADSAPAPVEIPEPVAVDETETIPESTTKAEAEPAITIPQDKEMIVDESENSTAVAQREEESFKGTAETIEVGGDNEKGVEPIQEVHKETEAIPMMAVDAPSLPEEGPMGVEATHPEKQDDDDANMDVEVEAGPSEPPVNETETKRKRDDEDEQEILEKRPRLSSAPSSAPEASSSSSHPPSRALYISNLRRPLQTSDLRDLLEPYGELDETIDGMSEGMWINGVKSHCYCVYVSDESAQKAVHELESTVFPADTGLPIHLSLLPVSLVASFVAHEKSAWTSGRTRLELSTEKIPEDDEFSASPGVWMENGWRYTLEKVGSRIGVEGGFVPGRVQNPLGGGGMGIRGMGVPGRGAPALGMGMRGGMGYGGPVRGAPVAIGGVNGVPLGPSVRGISSGSARPLPGNPNVRVPGASTALSAATPSVPGRAGAIVHPARQALVPHQERKQPSRGFQRTVAKPVLYWREADKWVN